MARFQGDPESIRSRELRASPTLPAYGGDLFQLWARFDPSEDKAYYSYKLERGQKTGRNKSSESLFSWPESSVHYTKNYLI